MKNDILAAAEENTILFDGGIGTQLQELGLPIGSSPEMWNERHPERVAKVHRAYLDAGARVLTTNSFGGSPAKLKLGLVEGDPEQINFLAARIARDVAGEKAWVAGSIGPTGALLMMEPLLEDEIFSGFQIQARGLSRGGADLIMIETMSDLSEALLAITAARSVCTLPVAVSMTFSPGQRGYRTMMGIDIHEAAVTLSAAGIDVLGCNCGTGIDAAIGMVKEIAAAWKGLILCEPNAGLPVLVDGKTVYAETPEMMAAKIPGLVQAGAHFVGGCCGTTPAHISAFQLQLSRSR